MGRDWSAPEKTMGSVDMSTFNWVDNDIKTFGKRLGIECQNNPNGSAERKRKDFVLFEQRAGSRYLHYVK